MVLQLILIMCLLELILITLLYGGVSVMSISYAEVRRMKVMLTSFESVFMHLFTVEETTQTPWNS